MKLVSYRRRGSSWYCTDNVLKFNDKEIEPDKLCYYLRVLEMFVNETDILSRYKFKDVEELREKYL